MSTNIYLDMLFHIYLPNLCCQNICLYQLACTYLSIQICLFLFLINNIFFVYNFVLSMFVCLYHLANNLFLFIYTVCQYYFLIRHYVTEILQLHTTVVLFYCIITVVQFSPKTMLCLLNLLSASIAPI